MDRKIDHKNKLPYQRNTNENILKIINSFSKIKLFEI